jgi:hypothetical protein
MAQHSKMVDVSKSFVVIDPNAFAENLEFTTNEDSPEKAAPILGFEGYNFLPTAYGYRSYFGVNSKFNVLPLASRCDETLIYQTADYANHVIALAEDGIWVLDPSIAGNAWAHQVTQAIPTVGTYKQWTNCIINNVLYMYREGDHIVHLLDSLGVWSSFVPCCTKYYLTLVDRDADVSFVAADIGKQVYVVESSLYYELSSVGPNVWIASTKYSLNMVGQMGIFRAAGMLAFWDSANSNSWANIFDVTDFTPSIETRAGNATFEEVRGRIVLCQSQGDGFVIYTTKGIVGVRFLNETNNLWSASAISEEAGIVSTKQVCTGSTDLEHYAYTDVGIKKIGNYNVINKSTEFAEALTEVYDLLRESSSPVYLSFVQGRYLFLQVVDPAYIYGRVSFATTTTDALTVRILEGGTHWDGVSALPTTVGGIPLGSSIGNEIASGVTYGAAMGWNSVSGNLRVPGRTSPLSPYTKNGTGHKIPNTPPAYDTSSQLTVGQVSNLVDGGSWTEPGAGALTASMEYVEYPRSTWTGVSTDVYLEEFLADQVADYAFYGAVQTATAAAINAGPTNVATTQGSTYYALGELQAQIDILINADLANHVGAVRTGNTVEWDEDAGFFLSGSGYSHPVAFSGVGTYHPTFTMPVDFTGGYRINRRVNKTYSQGSLSSPNARWKANAPSWRFGPLYTATPSIIDSSSIYGYGSTNVLAITDLFTKSSSIFPATLTIVEPIPYFWPSGTTVTASGIEAFSNNPFAEPLQYRYTNLSPNPVGGALAPGPYWFAKWGSIGLNYAQETGYNIAYTTTKYLHTILDATLTGTGACTGSANILDWLILTQYPPTGEWGYASSDYTVTGTGIFGGSTLPTYLDVTYPGATFLLQNGSPPPIYPTFTGALVFDTALKKWGKYKGDHKCIMSMTPINIQENSLQYTNFGMETSVLNAAGNLYLFDSKPTDSWIRYGKIGFSRLGFTQVHEVVAHFRQSSTGNIIVDSSLDGRSLEIPLRTTWGFTGMGNVTAYVENNGRWHTIIVSGIFDLNYLELRGNITARR